jgi:hypothetical protein
MEIDNICEECGLDLWIDENKLCEFCEEELEGY